MHGALTIVQGLLPLANIYLLKLIVDAVTEAVADGGAEAAFRPILVLVALAAGVMLLGAVTGAGLRLSNEALSQHVVEHVTALLHARSTTLDLEYFENADTYDALHRAQQEAPTRPVRILGNLTALAQNLISLLAVGGLLLGFNPLLVLGVLLLNLPDLLVRRSFARRLYDWQHERTPRERRAGYYNQLAMWPAYAKELRLFGLGDLFLGRFRELRSRLIEERLRFVARRSLWELGSQVLAIVAVFASVAWVAWEALRGSVTLGDLVMYFQAFQRGQAFLRTALVTSAGLHEDALFLSHLQAFLDLEPRVVDPETPTPLRLPLSEGIVFDGVHFAYPTSGREVLCGIDLAIRPGETIALVGENGAGKTTLAKLLCRFYDPSAGRITLDGVDLRRFDRRELWRAVSATFQDFATYQTTARENVWFGDTSEPATEHRLRRAIERGGADSFLGPLRDGYETMLGKWFGEGEELSVGEWQRVALSRMFYRDAPIAILDEPTSALDAEAENDLFERLRELTRERTTILISHRFSTVRLADCIVVMEDGRIVERGTHEELLALDGRYARMFRLQAEHYS